MVQYQTEKISIEDVYKFDKARFNTNNHWVNETKPQNYNNLLEQSYLHKWIDNFRQYELIVINN